MIKKIGIYTILLLVLYICFRDYWKPNIVVSQSEWQNTQIKIDDYLYSATPLDAIAVGSSIANRIKYDSLKIIYNLSFEGNSALSGIQLIKEKGIYPKYILIELNTISILNKDNLNKKGSLTYPLRKYFKTFRDGRQPLPLLDNIVESKLLPYVIPYEYPFIEYNRSDTMTDEKLKIMNKILIQQADQGSKKQKNQDEDILDILSSEINNLLAHDTKIFFFIVPSEGTIKNAQFILNEIKQKYEGNPNISYIPYPSVDSIYQTTDGWHLDKTSAILYTEYLKNELVKAPINIFDNLN